MSIVVNLLGRVDEISGIKGSSVPAHDEDDLLSIALAKPADHPESIFGLAYRVNNQEEVIITAVLQESIADWYNMNCETEKTICAGDKIFSANRKKTAKEIVDELKAAKEVNLTLIKAGPRWHISGICADSMERIFKAQDKGLNFELRQPDDLEQPEEEPTLSGVQCLLIWLCVGAPNCVLTFFFSDTGFGFKVYEILAPSNRNLAGNGLIVLAFAVGIALYVADWTKWQNRLQRVLTALFVIYVCFFGALLKCRFYPQVPLVGILMHIPVFIGVLRVGPLKGVKRISFYKGVSANLFFWGFAMLALWLAWMLPGEEGQNGWKGKHTWSEPTKRVLVEDADPIYKEFTNVIQGSERRTYYDMDCDPDTKTDKLCASSRCDQIYKPPGFGLPMRLSNLLVPAAHGLYCCNLPTLENQTLNCKESSKSPCPYADTPINIYRVPGSDDGSSNLICCDQDVKLTSDERLELFDSCAKAKTIWFLVWLAPFACFGVDFLLGIFCVMNGVYLNATDASKLEKTLKQFITLVMFLLLTMYVGISIAGASMRLTGTLLAFCAAGLVLLFLWVYLEVGARAITVGARGSRLMQGLISLATNDWARAIMVIGLNMLIPFGLVVNMMNQSVRRMRGASKSPSRFTDGMEFILVNLRMWNWAGILIKVNWLCLLYWTLSIGVAKITSVFLSWLNQELLKVDFVMVCVIFFLIGFTMFMLPPVPGLPVYMSSGVVLSARARSMELGFWGGTLVAVVLSFVLKLLACSGQYMIGFGLGKYVKIQQQVGVDKVFIRAVQRILEKPGMPLSKVSVLIGGPDWPTSVLCGILRLNLASIILGTCPVIFVSTPVVLSGSFMAGPSDSDSDNEQDSGIWNTLTPVMIGVAALGQLASAVVAVYYIQEVVFEHGVELAKPRKEHEPVARLTKAEQEFVQAYNEVLQWNKLPRSHKLPLLASSLGMMLANFVFVFMDEACFREFKVNKKISDPFDEQGLDGNAFNIIKWPGILGHVVFISGAMMHFGFLQWAKRAGKMQQLKNRQILDKLIDEGAVATESEERRLLPNQEKLNIAKASARSKTPKSF